MAEERVFEVSAHYVRGKNRNSVCLGDFCAESAVEAISLAKGKKGDWAATRFGCTLADISWEAEEDFFA